MTPRVSRAVQTRHAADGAPERSERSCAQTYPVTAQCQTFAEGLGRRSPAEKAHFFSIAKGSTTECAAIVDVVRSMGLAPVTLCREARGLLVRIIQMLTKLETSVRGR